MFKAFSSLPDSDESAIAPSTAPTTPDGSLTFSPVLQAAQLLDAFEGISGAGTHSRTERTLSATLDLDGTAPMVVKNICCVGAGYVGKFFFFAVVSGICNAPKLDAACRRDAQGPAMASVAATANRSLIGAMATITFLTL